MDINEAAMLQYEKAQMTPRGAQPGQFAWALISVEGEISAITLNARVAEAWSLDGAKCIIPMIPQGQSGTFHEIKERMKSE